MKISLLLDYRDQVLGLEQDLDVPRCYNCESSSHLLKQCPYSTKQRFSEATVRRSPDTNTTNGAKGSQAISNVVSNVTPVDDDTNISRLTVDPHLNSNNGEINNVIDSVIAQMHGITSSFSTGNIQLGPVLTAEVSVEGEIIEALLDTAWISSHNYTVGSPFRNSGKATSPRSNNI